MKILLSRSEGGICESVDLEGVHTFALDKGFAVVTFKDEDAFEEAFKRTAWNAWDEYGLSLEMPLAENKTSIVDKEYTVWLE